MVLPTVCKKLNTLNLIVITSIFDLQNINLLL